MSEWVGVDGDEKQWRDRPCPAGPEREEAVSNACLRLDLEWCSSTEIVNAKSRDTRVERAGIKSESFESYPIRFGFPLDTFMLFLQRGITSMRLPVQSFWQWIVQCNSNGWRCSRARMDTVPHYPTVCGVMRGERIQNANKSEGFVLAVYPAGYSAYLRLCPSRSPLLL
jgi:hypothetical protein